MGPRHALGRAPREIRDEPVQGRVLPAAQNRGSTLRDLRAGDEGKRGAIGMSATAIRAALDAHDALVRDCAEGRLAFGEFLGAYGDFPLGYASNADTASVEEREALRLFRKRVAFHRQVAGVISGLRGDGDVGSLQREVGGFMPEAGLARLRELVARHPGFEVIGADKGASP